MSENCESCQVSARVDSLEKEFDRYRDGSVKTHKEMFERLSALEQARASMKTMLEGMDGKLDKLVAWREMQDDKPNKFLDRLKDRAAEYIMIALLALLLLRLVLNV